MVKDWLGDGKKSPANDNFRDDDGTNNVPASDSGANKKGEIGKGGRHLARMRSFSGIGLFDAINKNTEITQQEIESKLGVLRMQLAIARQRKDIAFNEKSIRNI